MIRLLLRLLNIKDFEVCSSCETHKKSYESLQAQLEFSQAEKRELLETLLQLTKPEVKIQPAELKVLNPLVTRTSFRQKKSLLEDMNKRTKEVASTSPFIARPDVEESKEPPSNVTQQSIEDLEQKLGIANEA